MRPPEVFVRPLGPDEGQRLKRLSRRAKHHASRQRAMILLASATGMSAPEIARALQSDDSHVRKVIHAFNQRGLPGGWTTKNKHGAMVGEKFDPLRRVGVYVPGGEVPLVAMVSYAIVHRLGVERFLNDAATAGLDGMIVPDLPVEEAEAMMNRATLRGLKLIQLITPTTPRERAVRIGARFLVASTPGLGSRVETVVPIRS